MSCDFGPPENTILDLDLLRCVTSIHPREGITVERRLLYEEIYREEGFEALPPVAVFHDGADYWVADGFHRVYAAQELAGERQSIAMPVALYQGSQRDAMVFACGANARHGKSLSTADKRLAIRRLLVDPETAQWSARRIARYVGCDHHTVVTQKTELTSAPKSPQWQGFTYGSTTPAPAVSTPPTIPITDVLSPEAIRAAQPVRSQVHKVIVTHRNKEGIHAVIVPPGIPVSTPAASPIEAPTSSEAPTTAPVKPPISTPDPTQCVRPIVDELFFRFWNVATEFERRDRLAWAIKRLPALDAKHQEDASDTARNSAIIQQLFAPTDEGVHA